MNMPGSYSQPAREPQPIYTPSVSDEGSLSFPNGSSSERSFRLFIFRRDGNSWRDSDCKESPASESEIKARARRNRPKKRSVQDQWGKMGETRKEVILNLLDQTMDQDPDRCEWTIAAIDNDKPEHTKRTGEVIAFSVILERVTPRNRANSISDGRRKSFVSAEIKSSGRRPSKVYNTNATRSSKERRPSSPRTSRNQVLIEDELDDGYYYPQERKGSDSKPKIIQDDPFSNPVFAPNGKPITADGSVPFDLGGLPPHLPQETAIGDKSGLGKDGKKGDKKDKDKEKDKKGGKKKGGMDDDEVLDLDALLKGIKGFGVDDDEVLIDDDDDEELSHIEVIDGKNRGRKRNDSGFGEKYGDKTPKRSRSKNKKRNLSIHIPKTSPNTRPAQIYPAGGRSKYNAHRNSYHGSVASDYSGSILEPEYESYSSSGSSADGHSRDWRGGYRDTDGRYYRPSREHRRGPPSPTQGRYYDSHGRYERPRAERYVSEGALMRYDPPPSARPMYVSHGSLERFTPSSARPRSALFAAHEIPELMSVREIEQEERAQQYMRRREEMEREREMQLAEREANVARRESFIAQRESMVIGGRDRDRDRDDGRTRGGVRYNYDPRAERSDRDRRRSSYATGYHY